MGWAGNVASMREIRNAYRILVEKPGRKTSAGSFYAEIGG